MSASRRDGALARLVEALNPWRAAARARAEAQAAERRLREALDALPTGVVFLDSERRYILWNKAYGEIYHRSSDLFRVGRRLADTLRIGVERGDYPAAVGREEAWLAERLEQLQNPAMPLFYFVQFLFLFPGKARQILAKTVTRDVTGHVLRRVIVRAVVVPSAHHWPRCGKAGALAKGLQQSVLVEPEKELVIAGELFEA